MTEKEILEYNERCAEFLGFKYKNQAKYWMIYPLDDNSFLAQKGYIPIKSMKFHSDWNWIMEVRDKILSINSYINVGQRFIFNINACAKYRKNENDKPYKVRIKGVLITEPRPFIEVNSFDEKEAVVKAINQFLIWHNGNN